MNLNPEQQKKLLAVLCAALAALIAYRVATYEKPKTAPLTYSRGATATASARAGRNSPSPADPLRVFLVKREEQYPGVIRDIFRMENPAPPKPKPAPVLVTAPVPTVPPVPEKTPEQIAAEAARADLSKFRFLGYLTDKDSSLFLSKDGETFIVRSGDTVLRNYLVKEAGRDFVVLSDSITKVEVKVELSGGEQAPPPQQPQRGRFR
jgi:hypothetical protein